jgi:hypothetical protein
MQKLTIDMLEILVRLGAVAKVRIMRAGADDGWVMVVDHKDAACTKEVHTERGDLRVFKRTDTAIRAARGAGWKGDIAVLGDAP